MSGVRAGAARHVVAWLFALVGAASFAQSDPDDPLRNFGWLRELAGACWRGETADGKPVDTQCYEVQFGRFLRGTIAMTGEAAGKGAGLRGDSVWSWDAARQRIALTTWASNGSVASGEASFEGETVHFPVPRRDGSEPTARTSWQRVDATSYRVTRQRREGSAWADVQTVVYRRVP